MHGVTGVVRGLVQRVEQGGENSIPELVCTFRLERHDEEGRPLSVVPVEMRALSFRGALNDGDWVEIASAWQPGKTLEPKEVRNLTTGSSFRAKGSRGRQSLVGCLVFLVLAAIMVVVVVVIVSQAGNDFPTSIVPTPFR